MKRNRRKQHDMGAVEWIEEATHRLRTAPLGVTALYFIGPLPFVIGLLFFWADMSRNPFAKQHVVEASLGMAALFLWMKFWQALFARRMRGVVSGETPPPLTARACLRILATQLAFQPPGLILLPVSAVITIPFAWVYAFFQSTNVMTNDARLNFGELFRRAVRQAALWAAVNHALKAIMFIFTFFVLFNWVIVLMMLPKLIHILFGVDSVFAQSPMAMLNTTFIAAVFCLTYLSVDPILKVIYVLRCFYGESLATGNDLKAELKQYASPSREILSRAAVLLLCVGLCSAQAAEPTTGSSEMTPKVEAQTIPPGELDRAISDVIGQRKYIWRMPRETVAEEKLAEQGKLSKFIEGIFEMLKKVIKSSLEWIGRILDRLFGGMRRMSGSDEPGIDWKMTLYTILYVLIAMMVAMLVVFLFRTWRKRNRAPSVVAAAPMVTPVDIADESVGADQLPEDGWSRLARELLERGEYRLALRAYYLASLAHLASRELVTLAKFKSNRDYERELSRRGHALRELLSVFGSNVSVFDRIWYGRHEVNRETVGEFAANVERIKVGA
ncbi:MAG: DUF4129 domain-containing protein [Verrucomicrobia bacterium]|nr:DUF4129 domain-containing protein [Verrucomicrobiota bacterium]